MGSEACTVMVVDAVLDESDAEDAVIVTVAGLGTSLGAM